MTPNSNVAVLPEKPKDRLRLLLAIPTHEMVPASFMYDFANLVAYTTAQIGKEIEFTVGMVQGTYVHTARQDLTMMAIRNECDFILWIDSDMRFPRDALFRLWAHNKDIVGVNYSKRTLPAMYVGIKRTGEIEGDRGQRLITNDETTGLETCEALGFGFLLMHMDVIYEMGEKKCAPFFIQEYDFENMRNTGEDVWFCKKAAECGFEIWCDHDLSKEIKHIGQIEFRYQHAWDMICEGEVDADGHPVDPAVKALVDLKMKELEENGDNELQRTEDSGSELAEPSGPDGEDS